MGLLGRAPLPEWRRECTGWTTGTEPRRLVCLASGQDGWACGPRFGMLDTLAE
jgi:hypothetical protein